MMGAKNKIYITLGVFTALSLILIVFFVHPSLKTIKQGYKEILADRNSEASFSMQNAELDNFKEKYEEYEPHLEEIAQSYVDEKNPVDFIKFLEAVARDSGVTAEVNIISSPDQKEKTLGFVNFQIFAEGSFLDILAFSEKLETGQYLVSIKNLTIKKPGRDNPAQNSSGVEGNFSITAVSK